VTVLGPDARVEVAPGSDIAVDVLADPQTGAAFTAATAVAGSVTVHTRPVDPEDDGTVVSAGAAARTVQAEDGVVLETSEGIDAGVAAFWTRRAFEAEPRGPELLGKRFPGAFAYVSGFYGEEPAVAEPEPAPEPQPEPQPDAETDIEPLPTLPELDLTPPEFAERDQTDLRNGGLGLMAMGAIFAGAGLGVDYAGDLFLSDGLPASGVSPGTVMLYTGGGFFVSGLIAFLIGQF
jgi:hypothetical protein